MRICLKGSKTGECFQIELPERTEIAGDRDLDDGYGVPARLTVTMGCLYARIDEVPVVPDALYYFCEQLTKCYERLQGEAVYQPLIEEELEFSVKMAQQGKAFLAGCVRKSSGETMQVEFEMKTDQSSFPSMIQEINALEQEYSAVW